MHISDLHFGREDISKTTYVANRQMLINSFFDSFKEIPSEWKPDILVVTGDVAYSGKQGEYKQALEFFEKFLTLEDQKVKVKDIVFCPGNHDVYMEGRTEARPRVDSLDLTDVSPLTRKNIKQSKHKFNAFVCFLKELGIEQMQNSSGDEEVNYLYGFRKCKGINFIVLNTEWDFQGQDDSKKAVGRLRIGADLLDDALNILYGEDSEQKDPIVALFHRPLEQLHISERDEYNVDAQNNQNSSTNVENRLNSFTDIILHGHVHMGGANSKMVRAITYTCGTIHDPGKGEPSFWLFNIREKGDGESIKYKWVKPNYSKRNGVWKIDEESPYKNRKIFLSDNRDIDNKEQEYKKLLETIVKDIMSNNVSSDIDAKIDEAIQQSGIDETAKLFFKAVLEEAIERAKKTEKDPAFNTNRKFGINKELELTITEAKEVDEGHKKGKEGEEE